MKYILNKKEYNKLINTNNLLIETYQNTDNCIPKEKCNNCPLASINNKLGKICNKEII